MITLSLFSFFFVIDEIISHGEDKIKAIVKDKNKYIIITNDIGIG